MPTSQDDSECVAWLWIGGRTLPRERSCDLLGFGPVFFPTTLESGVFWGGFSQMRRKAVVGSGRPYFRLVLLASSRLFPPLPPFPIPTPMGHTQSRSSSILVPHFEALKLRGSAFFAKVRNFAWIAIVLVR